MNTIVLIANASLFNIRVEMPIYTLEKDIEVCKFKDFYHVLQRLGLKKFIEMSKFDQIIKTLKEINCIYHD